MHTINKQTHCQPPFPKSMDNKLKNHQQTNIEKNSHLPSLA